MPCRTQIVLHAQFAARRQAFESISLGNFGQLGVSRGQGFRFVQSAQFVRRLSEAVELSNSLLEGFGEPSYESLQFEKLKSPALAVSGSNFRMHQPFEVGCGQCIEDPGTATQKVADSR